MPTFEETFGQEYGSDHPQSQWDKPFFNNRDLALTNRFIAWIDLMGAANHFLSSLPKAACFVGKIHDAGLQANSRYPDVSLHPIADGFYAINEDWGQIKDFTSRVMRSLAYVFDSEDENRHRFIVRAGIAYGRFVDGDQMVTGSDTFIGQAGYFHNVFVGCPLAWAYQAEGKTAPFGIYIDQSVSTHSDQKVAWVLHRWWGNNESEWAKQFGNKVKSHLEWLNDNALATRYPTEKHDVYLKATKEYYEL